MLVTRQIDVYAGGPRTDTRSTFHAQISPAASKGRCPAAAAARTLHDDCEEGGGEGGVLVGTGEVVALPGYCRLEPSACYGKL